MLLEHHVVVSLEEGLHARPAARLAQLAKSFQSTIDILKGDRSANAKSTVKIMLLTVKEGERIGIRADGEDAAAAVAELAAFVAQGKMEAAADPPPPTTGIEPAAAADQAGGHRIEGIPGNEGVAVGRAFVFLPDHSIPARRPLSDAYQLSSDSS